MASTHGISTGISRSKSTSTSMSTARSTSTNTHCISMGITSIRLAGDEAEARKQTETDA